MIDDSGCMWKADIRTSTVALLTKKCYVHCYVKQFLCDYNDFLKFSAIFVSHGLYDSTSCCSISHGLVNGRGRFSTPQLRNSWTDIHETWNIYNYFPDTTRMQNFRGLCRRGWSGKMASFTHESFFFSFLRHAHRSHFWTYPHAQYVIIRRSRQGSTFGVRKMKVKIWLPLPLKT